MEWNNFRQQPAQPHNRVDVNPTEDDELVRMASLKDNTTNATILRDHVLNMRHVFEKFQTKHALALAKTAETPVTNATPLKSITTAESAPTKNEADLLEEISRLKEQLREKDKIIEALQTNK